MKAMSKKQLAYAAGVSRQTLSNWLKPHHQKLCQMGMRPRGVLPPNVVQWIVDNFCITLND